MHCPRCPVDLEDVVCRGVKTQRCVRCRGMWFDAGELAEFNRFDSDFPLRPDNPSNGKFTSVHCPHCNSFLERMPYDSGRSLEVDRCISCKGVWLDAKEIQTIRSLLAKKLVWRRRIKRLDETVRREQEMWESYTASVAEQETERRLSGVEWLFMFITRLPVEVYNPVRRIPRATLAILVANIAIFGLELVPTARVVSFAFIPDELRQLVHPYGIVTSLFLHANLMHLAGNMYFFYTFGDNVEDFLGSAGFTLLYFVCGIVGSLTHFAANIHSIHPTLGASGAISGVFAAYILLYPRRRIYFLVIIWPVKIRAIWYGLAWIALQIFYLASMQSSGVALWAHIGGFTAGVLSVEAYLKYKRLDPATTSA